MAAYDDMDKKISGLKQGLDSRVSSRIAARNISAGSPAFGFIGREGLCFPYLENTADITWTNDFVAGNTIILTITRDGGNNEILAPIVFDTDHDTTMNNLVNHVDTAVEGASARAPDTVNNRVLEISLNGYVIGVQVFLIGTANPSTIAYRNTGDFLGIPMFENKEAAKRFALDGKLLKETESYRKGDRVSIIINGWGTVEVGEAVDANSQVYILSSGTGKGKFGGAGEDNILVDALYQTNTDAAGVANIRIDK